MTRDELLAKAAEFRCRHGKRLMECETCRKEMLRLIDLLTEKKDES